MIPPLVTVLIDTYNYGQFIEQAIDSVLSQDFPAEQMEVLVVDDGSTDDTAERVKRYGSRIQYLQKPNGGQASAFNFGLAHARGELIALLDADDVWLPKKLRAIQEAFEGNRDAGMVYHRLHWWDGANEVGADRNFIAVSGRVPESRRALLEYPMASTSCLAFRRRVLEKLLPVPEMLRTQADAYLSGLVIFVAPVVAVPEYLGKYRVHGKNLFQINEANASAGQIEQRMAIRTVLLAEIETWLRKNDHDTATPDLRAYLAQWKLKQEQDSFLLNKPRRLQYFRHLLRLPWTYGEIMTRRHRAHSYARACAALVLGYRHLHLADDAWQEFKQRTAL